MAIQGGYGVKVPSKTFLYVKVVNPRNFEKTRMQIIFNYIRILDN